MALKISKYAGIDIGSNAIRLLIMFVYESENQPTQYKKSSLVRVPIRLGADVFFNGEVSQHNIERMRDTMDAYSLLLKAHGVEDYRACATSAMREAVNGSEVVALMKEKTGISIELINGEDEAKIIAQTNLSDLLNTKKNFLYVDVGGGSTELNFYSAGEFIDTKSFRLGTVRLLHDENIKAETERMKEWILKTTKGYTSISLIGSGGNINHIHKYSGLKTTKPLSFAYLKSYYDAVRNFSYDERIMKMQMKPDRADVIVPATRIYLQAMNWSNAKRVFVPKIGLADGIVKGLHNTSFK